MKPLLVASVIAVLAGPAAAQPGPAKPDTTPAKPVSSLKGSMVFYLAKGGPDACGPGCSEWIAAEGPFDAGAAARLRTFLAGVRGGTLPIFFHSPGGIVGQAVVIGQLLRQRGMTAGVSRTIPEGCAGAGEKACQALKQSKQKLPSELAALAHCNSACVYALVGAKVRLVPPGAMLGVHSSRLVKIRIADGRVLPPQPGEAERATAKGDEQIRRYLRDMGIDIRLQEAAKKVPHEKLYSLSRDEIAAFGIDARDYQETRWIAMESKPVAVRKFVLEAKGPDRKELRLSVISLWCAGPRRVGLLYIRGLASDENGAKQTIRLVANERTVVLPGPIRIANAGEFDAGKSFDGWGTSESLDFVEAVATRDSIEIATWDVAGATAPARVVKLSTAGLAHAIGALRQKCGDAGEYWGLQNLKPWGLTR